MYIGAVPKTPHNLAYVVKQAQTFLAGQNPPDFAKLEEGTRLVGLGADVDVKDPIGRVAMGLPIEVAHHTGEVEQDKGLAFPCKTLVGIA
jgi:hypothetical protein